MKVEWQHPESLDTVFIEGLLVEAVIGICDWEKTAPQALYFDIAMGVDARAVAENDDLNLGVDYAAVADAVKQFVRADEALLLETLLERLAAHLFAGFAIERLRLTVKKPAAIATPGVAGVTIERGRETS